METVTLNNNFFLRSKDFIFQFQQVEHILIPDRLSVMQTFALVRLVKISQLFELVHVSDGVKNVRSQGPERHSWRHCVVGHSGSRNSGASVVDRPSAKDRCMHSWSQKGMTQTFKSCHV